LDGKISQLSEARQNIAAGNVFQGEGGDNMQQVDLMRFERQSTGSKAERLDK